MAAQGNDETDKKDGGEEARESAVRRKAARVSVSGWLCATLLCLDGLGWAWLG